MRRPRAHVRPNRPLLALVRGLDVVEPVLMVPSPPGMGGQASIK